MLSLPIDDILERLVESVKTSSGAIIFAPPGAGKSTHVPPALLKAGLAEAGEIVVLQPRKLPARLLAKRVADEMGEKVGETAGYQVRFEDVSGPDTKIRFMTEGILNRRLLSDPHLRRASVVILDEFHERHIHTDLALALLRRLQLGPRPDLKIIVMSATLDPGPLSGYLGGAPLLRLEGRLFNVDVEHAAPTDEGPLETRVLKATQKLAAGGPMGDVLVFLPGAAEIRRCAEALASLGLREGFDITPLHGDMPLSDQERAVRPGKKPKVILSTNVAESSVTVEGVTAVIDSGLARIAAYSSAAGMNVLNVRRISKASARQRTGRAGRVRPGICLRLYSKQDYAARAEYELPEVARLDLAEALLLLNALGVKNAGDFPWFEPPPGEAVDAAAGLLLQLGALSENNKLTESGQSMTSLPLHPRLSRLAIECLRRGQGKSGAALAAMISEGGIRRRTPSLPRSSLSGSGEALGDSDLLEDLDRFEEAEQARFNARRLRTLDLNAGAVMAVRRSRDRLVRLLGSKIKDKCERSDRDLLISLLAAFPDRVARRRPAAKKAAKTEFVLAAGGSAVLDRGSLVRGAEWIVAVDLDQRRKGAKRSTIIRQASAIEPDWIIELFFDRVQDAKTVAFNAEAGRVETARRILYRQLVIDETPDPNPDLKRVADALFEAARARGLRSFDPDGKLEKWLARLAFVRKHAPALDLPRFNEPEINERLKQYCTGKFSLKDLAGGRPAALFESMLTQEQKKALSSWAPERIALPSGRNMKVVYSRDAEPYGASRLQDFFGMKKGPALAGGKVPLILHLLAPNGRAVQITTDLEGFWQRHYPKIARELRRRYPKHAWPADPEP